MAVSTGLVHADADLEKASALFPAFSKAVYSNEDKAEEIYKQFTGMSPTVQQRLLAWLDKEFADKKATYQAAKSGGSSGIRRSGSRADAAKIKELQLQLSQIRNTSNEGEMKKKLKETGWPALKQLLRLKGSTIRSLGDADISDPDPAKAKSAYKEAKQVGKFLDRLFVLQ